MVSQAAQSAPPSKFTLGGFVFPSRQEIKNKPVEEDEWYIPYNGPYEPPRESPRQVKPRDSWGDALEEFDDGDMLSDRELHIRYGGDFHSRQYTDRYVEDDRKDGGRDRSFSVNSARTTSSGAMDPGRGSLSINRRSTVSAANPPPLPSYVNLNRAGGGVGESPMPHLKNVKEPHRISIASIFSLGSSNRKSVAPHTPEHVKTTNKQIRSRQSPKEIQQMQTMHSKGYTPNVGDSPGGQRKAKLGKNKYLRDQVKAQNEHEDSTITNNDAYYNTYYQSVSHNTDHDHARLSPSYQSRSPTASSHSRNSSIRQQEGLTRSQNFTMSNSGRHPYANATSLAILPLPQTAPPTSAPNTGFNTNNPPKLTFTTVAANTAGPSSAVTGPSKFPSGGTGSGGLKNSISTPNLRSPSSFSGSGNEHTGAQVTAPKFIFPRGKERWLSAETWCDALLFPRPRLRVKQDFKHGIEGQKLAGAGVPETSTGRIVSPPTTPTEQRDFETQQLREPGIASRVLAHSRSLVDLRLNKGKKKEKEEAIHPSILQYPQASRPIGQGQTLRPPRPKSFALDDLALPSPVPSLAHVLREGEILATERRAWQQQAQGSFGNKHSRTVSRTRSKSLTQKGHRKQHNHQSSLEYVAAQACLGAQNYSPTIVPPRLSYFTDGTSATASRGTHSHSNSLVKTLTKSSKSHSRNHSRNESWSKSAMRVVTKPLAALSSTEPASHNKAVDLEDALRTQGTKVIRLADPVHLPLNRGTAALAGADGGRLSQNVQRQTPSPALSNLSDSRVGIALGTPPEEAAPANYIPSHPYAQGGLSFNTVPVPGPAEYAGPHRSVNNTHGAKIPTIPDILARHKLPPHIALHPYAQTSNRDSYLNINGLTGQPRSDHIPSESRMWAQLSPSAEVVHEVLPDDLQYSPFSPEGSTSRSSNRHTMNIRDTVGLGEALVNAVNASRFRRASPDSGLGTSESHEPTHQLVSQRHHRPNLEESLSGLQGNVVASSSRIDDPDNGQASMFLRPHDVSNRVLVSSNDVYLPVPPLDPSIRHPSPSSSSSSYSLNQSSRVIGSPNDLESFQDLFFRPSVSSAQRTPNEAALPETPLMRLRSSTPWDASLRSRTDSSLTNLARQLSDEFEQMAREMSDPHSDFMTSSRQVGQGSLQFLFEDVSVSVSPPDDQMDDTIQAFKPTGRLPEDVLSSRASSFIEGTAEDDDPTVIYRVGMVESVSTPPPVSNENRVSYSGQTTLAGDDSRHGLSSTGSDLHARILSGLQPPLTDVTRSSYTSASTLSRISNLSDFPVPPKNPDHPTPRHMSLLSSYFDEAMSQSDSRPTPLLRAPPLLEEDRVTFGSNQNADDLVKTLSSPNPEPF